MSPAPRAKNPSHARATAFMIGSSVADEVTP
jgi:hypothetical protein